MGWGVPSAAKAFNKYLCGASERKEHFSISADVLRSRPKCELSVCLGMFKRLSRLSLRDMRMICFDRWQTASQSDGLTAPRLAATQHTATTTTGGFPRLIRFEQSLHQDVQTCKARGNQSKRARSIRGIETKEPSAHGRARGLYDGSTPARLAGEARPMAGDGGVCVRCGARGALMTSR